MSDQVREGGRVFGLGRLRAPDDKRDLPMRRAFASPAAATGVKPRTFPYKLGKTLNQGDDPRCTGTASRHKIEAAPFMVKPGVGLTDIEIYLGAKDHDEWPGSDYDGSSVRGAFKFLHKRGYLKSYVFAAAVAESRKFMRDGHGTVVDGTNWYAQMFYPINGVLPKIPARATPVGGHAYHVVWSFLKGDARIQVPKAWAGLDLSLYDVIQNSWGAQYEPNGWEGSETFMGQGGCVLILKSERDRLFREDGEIGAGLERKIA